MRRFGLADGLGLVAALTAFVWLPGSADPLTYPKLIVLAAGGLALAPFVAHRWIRGGRPALGVIIVAGAALAIVIWGLVSTLAAGAPWAISLFGWWGRGDGWLAWLGAASLLLGAATLSRQEVTRTVTWLLGGGTAVALIGLLQVAGLQIPGEGMGGNVTGTMGNTNFAAGYFAMIGVLAAGRALTPGRLAERIWAGSLFLLLVVLAVLTDSLQGPAALAAGLVVLGISWSLLYRGRYRAVALGAAGVTFILGAALMVASFFAVGPLARLWAEQTFDIRQEYWQSAIRIMNALPVFGTGPDSFSRYVAEYRPESYVELLGPVLRVSAAHNVALQFGAVLGYPGLILWAILFGGTAILLLIRLLKGSVGIIALTASVAGAFVAYVVQGMVSIDMLPILATGWTLAGLAIAVGREPVGSEAQEQQPSSSPSRTRKVKAAAARTSWSPPSTPRPPIWVPVASGSLAVVTAIAIGQQMGLTNQVQSISSQEQAIAFIRNPATPCPLRVQVTQQVIQQLPAEVSVPATLEATDLDRRCPPMINFASDVLVQQQRFAEADGYTSEAIMLDPLLDLAWVLRSRYLIGVGDIPGAQVALEEAKRVQALYPADKVDPALVSGLAADLAESAAG